MNPTSLAELIAESGHQLPVGGGRFEQLRAAARRRTLRARALSLTVVVVVLVSGAVVVSQHTEGGHASVPPATVPVVSSHEVADRVVTLPADEPVTGEMLSAEGPDGTIYLSGQYREQGYIGVGPQRVAITKALYAIAPDGTARRLATIPAQVIALATGTGSVWLLLSNEVVRLSSVNGRVLQSWPVFDAVAFAAAGSVGWVVTEEVDSFVLTNAEKPAELLRLVAGDSAVQTETPPGFLFAGTPLADADGLAYVISGSHLDAVGATGVVASANLGYDSSMADAAAIADDDGQLVVLTHVIRPVEATSQIHSVPGIQDYSVPEIARYVTASLKRLGTVELDPVVSRVWSADDAFLEVTPASVGRFDNYEVSNVDPMTGVVGAQVAPFEATFVVGTLSGPGPGLLYAADPQQRCLELLMSCPATVPAGVQLHLLTVSGD